MHAMLPLLKNSDFPPIRRGDVETLQVNLGYRCNQRCLHCHVNAGPNRSEMMAEATVNSILTYLQAQKIQQLDVTGGAPEMNPHFRKLVVEAKALGVHVIDRCNLSIIEEPGFEWLCDFLAEYEVEVVASLPCYLEANVDAQRGDGVFQKSIAALRKLNGLGYGQQGGGHKLTLVYNPQAAQLPPPQAELEVAYKRELKARYDIDFDRLFTITNMPIARFGSQLVSRGDFAAYMTLLKQAFRSQNLDGVMCRTLISIDWQGYVYDCDFNQMLSLPMGGVSAAPLHIDDLLHRSLTGEPITVLDHCYGCTAGQGSSCGGAI